MLLLAWVLPTVMLVFGGTGLAVGAYALRRWAESGRELPPNGDGDGDGDNGADPQPNGGDQDKGTSPAPQGAKCSRTGEMYDANRWASPNHVAAGLVSLGYPVGPTLKKAADKDQIKRFQRDAINLKLRGLAGAGNNWVDGKMGACTLLSLSNAESLLKAGKWIERSEPNWFEKMTTQAGWNG